MSASDWQDRVMSPDEMRAYLDAHAAFAAKVRERARELAATLPSDGQQGGPEALVASEGTKGPRKLTGLSWWLSLLPRETGRMG